MRKSHNTDVITFASRSSLCKDQSLQKSFHLSHPDKIELKKYPSLLKIKILKRPTKDTQKSVAMRTPKPLTVKHSNYSVDRRLVTSVLR